VSNFPIPEGRRFRRTALRKRASLVIKLGEGEEMIPCVILDSSQNGFRLHGTDRLRRGQMVEVILDDSPFGPVTSSVVWVGKAGSKHEGEVGLRSMVRRT
jgi:hypothetical protein